MISTVTLNPSLDEWIILPSLKMGELNRATGFMRYPGGKGINVSRVVHEFRQPTIAYALAGGEDGLILRERMNRLSIRHSFVEVEGATRNNYKIQTQRPRALTEINAPGPAITAASLRQLERRVLGYRPLPKIVALSGSLPPGAPSTTYARWIRLLRRRKVPVVLDASGAALRHGLLEHPWAIKPNQQEAEAVLQRRLTTRRSLVAGCRELLARGPEIAILSLGRDGALLASKTLGGVWLATPPSVRVNSAVGAGDSLVGGLLVGWVQRRPLLEAFRLGVACGTATAMTPGTQLCHRKDVLRLLPRVKIRKVG